MVKNFLQVIHSFPMINQEDGANPGAGLSATETVVTFVLIPVGLFVLISVIAWALTAPKKSAKAAAHVSPPTSIITSID